VPGFAGRDRVLTLLLHARFARSLIGRSADEIRQRSAENLDALFPGVKKHIKFAEIFVYPEAVAYWPLELGRSRFDALANKLREPQDRLYIGGDMTEDSHSEGAVVAALRMSQAIATREGRTIPAREQQRCREGHRADVGVRQSGSCHGR